jgi:hypothetical protein
MTVRSFPRALGLGLVGLLGLAVVAGPGWAEDTVRFELCGRELASVELGQFPGPQPWGVLVQLAPADAETFRTATAEHVGALLEITHGARIFVSGRVSGEIRTGLITATYEKKEDAERSRSALREKNAEVCAGT